MFELILRNGAGGFVGSERGQCVDAADAKKQCQKILNSSDPAAAQGYVYIGESPLALRDGVVTGESTLAAKATFVLIRQHL